jgi:hypothetical protein
MGAFEYNIDYLKNELSLLIEYRNYQLQDKDILELSEVIDELICTYYFTIKN